jgi:LysM repeat protein
MSVGGLQFQNASWGAALDYLNDQGYDTSTWSQTLYQGMPASEVPDKYQTVLAAEALLAIQGSGAWVCTGIGLDASMFEGGPTPAIVAGGGTSTPVDPSPDDVVVPSDDVVEEYDDHIHHTVQPGDTLYRIAQLYLGNGHKWGQVYNVPETREVVGDNPNRIYPGQDIRVNTRGGSSEPSPSEPAPVEPSHTSYVHPCGYPVGQVYGNLNSGYSLGYHTGVDFSAPAGANAVAVTSGTVVEPDSSSAYGTNVQIEWADGTYGLYAHLAASTVSVGDEVAPGDLVGYVGSTGNSSGPHLHFEIRTVPQFGEGNFLDPIQYLQDNGLVI